MYLNSYNLADTPFVTASIRNRTTKKVTGSLSFETQQGQYPNEFKKSLKYENDTGIALSDLEFYYQVNVPKAHKGAGNPVVNLKNIAINYRVPTVTFNRASIKSSQRLLNTFYMDVHPNVEVFSGSLTYFVPSTDFYKVGVITGETELFRFNEYASVSNNVDSLRKSSRILKVDERAYSPTQGPYKGFFLPGNYEILSGSIANGINGLDERFFAEVQDSNYSSTGWRNGRYDGTKTTDMINNVRVLGQEPALTFNSFEGSLFDSSSISSEIKTKFSGSEEKVGDIEVYYNTFELDAGNTLSLSNISSVENNSTRTSFDTTTYAFNLGNNDVGGGTFQGFIGPKITTDEIVVVFDVTLDNLSVPDLDVAGLAVNILASEDNSVLAQSSFVGTDFTHGGTVTKTITLEPSRNTANATLQFVFSSFEGDTSGTPDVTLNITSINRFSLLPVHSNKENIIQLTDAGRTIMYSKVSPTPTSPNGFVPIVASKLFRFGNSTVYTTNDKGIVTNIE